MAKPARAADDDAVDFSRLLSHAHFALDARMTEALEGVGISLRGYCVLEKAAQGAFSQVELGAWAGIDKTTMVVTLDELEARGFARRTAAAHDRRARVIAVTPAGKKKIDEAAAIVDGVHRDVWQALPKASRQAFVDALTALVDGHLAAPRPGKRPRD